MVYRVPQRGGEGNNSHVWTQCVCVCVISPFYYMRQKGEKHFFFYDSSQVQSTRTQKRDLNAFLLSISGAFHAGYSRARSIHQVCARPSSLARYFSPSFIFFKGIPTERTVKENEKREREREGCVLPFQ